MTQRSERWLIVGGCITVYALAMALVAWAIREPVHVLSDWLGATFGRGWGLAIAAIPPAAAGVWAMWPDPNYKPPLSANAKGPRWARYLGNAYLALLGISIVVVLGAIIRAG